MSKSFNPIVSIVIPVYNGSNYVKEAIDSALAQTYNNIEIIVINDGSNDNGKTDKICKSYGKRIRYFKKENGGVSSALNMGIEKMEGEYFSWLSHDDVYYPGKVEKQVEALSKLDDKTTVIYSGYEIIDKDGNHITQTDFESKHKIEDLNKPLYPFFYLILNGCSMLIHKTIFKKVGIFNEKLPTTQDYDLWFRILRKYSIQYDNHILLKSRSHIEQGSKLLIDKHIEECNDFWLGVFSSLSEKEILNISNSSSEFYTNLYNSFKESTLYDKVISYLERKMLNSILFEYRKGNTKSIKDLSEVFSSNLNQKTLEKVLKYPQKTKLRVLFFTGNWFDRGGINRVISVISPLLVDEYETIVCCMREEGNEKGYEIKEKVGFLELEESDFLSIPELLKFLEVDVFVGSNNCFAPLLNLYEHIENLGIRVIMWNHESYFEPFYDKTLSKALDIRESVYKKVSVVLWLSKVSAIISKVFTNKVLVMENPLTITSDGDEWKREKPLDIISVARFNSPRKRIDRLIEVFAKILETKPETKLYIVGPYDLTMKIGVSETETVEDLIDRFSIPSQNIIFTGEIKNVNDYYQKASVNIISSEREGFGLTVLEAALFGLPSVVFSGGGASEIISDGENGFVVEDGDIELMAKKVVELLNKKTKYSQMSINAHELANKYRKELVALKWKELIRSILDSNEAKLLEFCERNSMQWSDNSEKYMKEIVSLYEGAIEKQKEDAISELQSSLSWKSTKTLRKLQHLKELFKTQGIRKTTSNILLKMKEKS